jgi:hypothetical protein
MVVMHNHKLPQSPFAVGRGSYAFAYGRDAGTCLVPPPMQQRNLPSMSRGRRPLSKRCLSQRTGPSALRAGKGPHSLVRVAWRTPDPSQRCRRARAIPPRTGRGFLRTYALARLTPVEPLRIS